MTRGTSQLAQACLLVLMVSAGGCQHALWAENGARLASPDVPGRPVSIVFRSAPLHQAIEVSANLNQPAGLPWYASRNDLKRATFAGYRTPTVDQIVTYTRDRQTTSGNQLHDNYSQITYRRSVTRTVR